MFRDCGSCDAFQVFRPKVIFEEKKWCPFPISIKQCLDSPPLECSNPIKEWCKQRKLRAQEKAACKRLQQQRDRLERERYMRELQRIYKYHRKRCRKIRAAPIECKSHKKTCIPIPAFTRKCKKEVAKSNRECSSSSGKMNSFLRVCCDVICGLALVFIIGFAIIYFI